MQILISLFFSLFFFLQKGRSPGRRTSTRRKSLQKTEKEEKKVCCAPRTWIPSSTPPPVPTWPLSATHWQPTLTYQVGQHCHQIYCNIAYAAWPPAVTFLEILTASVWGVSPWCSGLMQSPYGLDKRERCAKKGIRRKICARSKNVDPSSVKSLGNKGGSRKKLDLFGNEKQFQHRDTRCSVSEQWGWTSVFKSTVNCGLLLGPWDQWSV